MKQYRNRDKAFLGTLIGTAVSVGGGLIGGLIGKRKQRRAQRRAEEQQKRDINYKNMVAGAENINRFYDNEEEYQNAFLSQYNLRCGGKRKLKCGGKKKAELGDIIKTALPGVTSGIGSIINSATNSTVGSTLANATTEITANHFDKLADKNLNNIKGNKDKIIVINEDDKQTNVVRYGGRRYNRFKYLK